MFTTSPGILSIWLAECETQIFTAGKSCRRDSTRRVVCSSTPLVGSSSRTTSGLRAKHRTKATRWYSPPESVRHSLVRTSVCKPTARSNSVGRK
mmetsp:Transcript_23775/g.28698  ORF Transcript_23775/g.28698 Transcript_23775/m.28698 type:complete len:94 (+) Transcript_23775:1094-1375(+)